MIQCQNCGQTNNYGSNFCRFCGTRMVMPQNAQPVKDEYVQPRPYMWKTDEYQVRDNPVRKTQNFRQSQMSQEPNTMTMRTSTAAYRQPDFAAYGYHCPRCGSQHPPQVTRKISAAGWVVFAILLVSGFFSLFCWIGLLIKEEIRVCPVCNVRIS